MGSVWLVVLLLLVLIGAGILGGLTYYRTKPKPPVSKPRALSQSTRELLRRLDSPVEVRFYSIPGGTGLNDEQRAFAERVSAMLDLYEKESGGKLKVTRHMTDSPDIQQAARADGLKGFNADEGGAAYLGIGVVRGAQKEALPQLSPEWEEALEPDLTRCIQRLLEAGVPPGAPTADPETARVALEQVKAAIPDAATVTLDQGKRILREEALKEFQQAAQDMESQVAAARTKIQALGANASQAEHQAAMQHLQSIQSTHTEQLKTIAAQLEDRLAAWEQVKRQ